MLRMLTVSFLVLGTLSLVVQNWIPGDDLLKASLERFTAESDELFEAEREATLLSVQLTNEREAQFRMMAIRDKALEDLKIPGKSLLEVSYALHGQFLAVYPRHFGNLQRCMKGQSEVEQVAEYLVKYVQYKATLNTPEAFDRERAREIESELHSTSFSSACQLVMQVGKKSEHP